MAFDRNGDWRPDAFDANGYSMDASTASTESSETPDQTYARLTREQFDDQQRRYLPFEQMSYDMVLDPEKRQAYRDEGIGIVNSSVDRAFDAAENRVETVNSRYNQSRSKRQKNIGSRQSAIDRVSLGVSSRNNARQYMDDRELELIGV